MKKTIMAALLCLCAALAAFAADYKTGQDAIAAGDYKAAFALFKKAAAGGDTDAGVSLANMYMTGSGVEQDVQEAYELFKAAADKGDARAQNGLGYMYHTGLLGDPDYAMALKYYNLSAGQGFEAAYNGLGGLYEAGNGVEQDLDKAVDYYRKAADKGDSLGMNNLAFMLINGRGIDKDVKTGMEWLEKSAAMGNMLAITNLVEVYKNGYGDLEPDPEKYFKWVKKGAGLMEPKLSAMYAECYEKGTGVKADPKEARRLYGVAAELGSMQGQLSYGFMNEHGKGGAVDLPEALKWYTILLARLPEGEQKEEFRAGIADTTRKMTKQQINEGKERARKWAAKNR